MTSFTREVHIAEDILWVDGISGSAKSMLFPVIASFERVEAPRMEHIYEHLCLLHHFGKIQTDAARALMGVYTDLAIHDKMISREVNFRPTDDSSVFKTPGSLRYLKRLFLPDGPIVLNRIRAERPILHIMTHQVLCVSDLAFKTFGSRLRIIVMVRHPLYVMPHWVDGDWGRRYGADPKDFTLWIEHGGRALPWWAQGWEEEYMRLSPMGRVVRSISSLTQRTAELYGRMEEERKRQVLFVPFEGFVTDPWPWVGRIESFLGTRRGEKTAGMLKKQGCPRLLPQDGLNKLREKYLAEAPERETRELLQILCQDYERAYGAPGSVGGA